MSAPLVFDVGANEGQDAVRYLAAGFRVVAVEADPTLAERRCWIARTGECVARQRVTCYPLASCTSLCSGARRRPVVFGEALTPAERGEKGGRANKAIDHDQQLLIDAATRARFRLMAKYRSAITIRMATASRPGAFQGPAENFGSILADRLHDMHELGYRHIALKGFHPVNEIRRLAELRGQAPLR